MSVLTVQGHAHEENEVGIKIDQTNMEDKFGRLMARIEKWTIVGALQYKGTGDTLQQRMDAIEAVYQTGNAYNNATFVADKGQHSLTGADSYSGVKVKSFGYMSGPWKMRTELANRRSFYAVLQAEFRGDFEQDLISYREDIEIIGNGGPHFILMPSLQAVPEPQTINLGTSVKYIQRGVAVGRLANPNPNPALMAAYVHEDMTRIGHGAPTSISWDGVSQNNEHWATRWTYIAESALIQTVPDFNLPDITPA